MPARRRGRSTNRFGGRRSAAGRQGSQPLGSQRRNSHPLGGRRLAIESLEPRRLLAITVDTDLDIVDPADGFTSLREAVAQASPGETIQLAVASPVILLDHADGEIRIDRSLHLVGPGADTLRIVPVRSDQRAFLIDDGDAMTFVDVSISGVTLSGGNVATTGGAILNREDLSLFEVALVGNTAAGNGGAIASTGPLAIVQSRIEQNHSAASGGGVWSSQELFVDASVLTANTAAGDGGAIHAAGLTVVFDSWLHNNTSQEKGGGVKASGRLELDRTTLSENTATRSGGGVDVTGELVTVNSTVSGNRVTGENGLGAGAFVLGSVELRNTTVVQNRATGAFSVGGGLWNDGGAIVIASSILAENEATLINPDLRPGGGLLAVTLSVIGDRSGTTLLEAQLPDASGNVIGDPSGGGLLDPRLGPLELNSGTTPTHAPAGDSPAIDRGGESTAFTDQRGAPFVRVFDGNNDGVARLDAGAVERQRNYFVVDTLVDERDDDLGPGDLSLREAIDLANQAAGDFPDVIVFASWMANQSIRLDTQLGQLQVTDDLVISATSLSGPVTIDAQHGIDRTPKTGDGTRVLHATGATLELENLVITGGDRGGNNQGGGGIWSDGRVVLRDSMVIANATSGSGSGGGGVAAAVVELVHSTVQSNSTAGNDSPGGGVYGVLQTEQSIVQDNSTTGARSHGGGVYLPREMAAAGGVVNGLTVQRNSALGSTAMGGGIYAVWSDYFLGEDFRVFIRDSTILNNRAAAEGGGVAAPLVSLIVQTSVVAGNQSAGDGGGLFVPFDWGSGSGAISIAGSTISNNVSQSQGGGVYAGMISAHDSSFLGNVDASFGGAMYAHFDNLSLDSVVVSGNSSGVAVVVGRYGINAQIRNSTIAGNHGDGITAGFGTIYGPELMLLENTTITDNAGAAIRLPWWTAILQVVNTTIVGDFRAEELGSTYRISGRDSILAGEFDLPDSSAWQAVLDLNNSIITNNAGTNLSEAPIGSPDAQGNIVGGPVYGLIDTLLGPLSWFGGPTPTRAPLPGSPATDAGSPTPAGVSQFDQRGAGYLRLQDGNSDGVARIDIGAVEVQRRRTPALTGDYNRDGVVNAADYTVWRDSLGLVGVDPFFTADGDGDRTIDQEDGQLWASLYGAAATISQGDQSPLVDGQIDPFWEGVTPQVASRMVVGAATTAADLGMQWRSAWDDQHLYFLIEVTDEARVNDSVGDFLDDGVEIYLDGDFSRGSSYDGVNDVQYWLPWGGGPAALSPSSPAGFLQGVQFAQQNTAGGYRMEVAIPWSTLQVSPADRTTLGLEVAVLDDDGVSGVDRKLQWHGATNRAFFDPSAFGPVVLLNPGATTLGTSAPSSLAVETASPAASEELAGVSDDWVFGQGLWPESASYSQALDVPSIRRLTTQGRFEDDVVDHALLLLVDSQQPDSLDDHESFGGARMEPASTTNVPSDEADRHGLGSPWDESFAWTSAT